MIEKEFDRKEFEKAPEQDWKDNLINEYLALDSRCGRLHRFIEWSDEFGKLDKERQGLLVQQLGIMKDYLVVLSKRARLEGLWEQIANIMQ